MPVFNECKNKSGTLDEMMFPVEHATVKCLPAVYVSALNDMRLADIKVALNSNCDVDELQVLRIRKSSKSILINNLIKLGSSNSRCVHCGKVFIDNTLMETNHFIKCTVKRNETVLKYWFVNVTPMQSLVWISYTGMVNNTLLR